MRKIIKICIISYIVVCIIVVIVLYKYVFKKNDSISINHVSDEQDTNYDEYSDKYFLKEYDLHNLTEEEKKRILTWETHGAYELILLMCKRNGDWSKLPISKETREQYNEKDGLLKDYDFDSIEIDPKTIGIYDYDPAPAQILITKGKEVTRVYIDYSFYTGGICQVEIKDAIKIVDKNGNKLNEGFPFNEKYILQNFETWANVGLTEKFKSKYGEDLLNLFTHYSPLDYNPIGFDIKRSDLNNNMAYFIVKSVLECKEREYEVHYQLDENNYLEDVYVICVKERELEPDNKELFNKIFYKNSNWNNLNLSDSFLKKFNNAYGVFPDINMISYSFNWDSSEYECVGIKKGMQLVSFKFMNGAKIYYLYSTLYNTDGDLDDVVYEKLPYENMSIEEVKELYLKEHQK